MNQLTQEQIKTLEDAFASYPEDFPTTSKYASMDGIQKQLDGLNGKLGLIYYTAKVKRESDYWYCDIQKFIVGNQILNK